MKKLIPVICMLAVTTAAFSQSNIKVSQIRELNSFTCIDLNMPATVYITQANNFSVQVSAVQDVLDKVITVVEGNTLTIKTNQKDWWKLKADVIVRITMPKPNQLHVNGSGVINIENNLTTDFLSLQVHGSGIIKALDYKAKKAETGVYGSGVIKQQNIIADGLVEEIEGSGIIETASISARLVSLSQSGSGNIKSQEINCENLESNGAGSGNIVIKKGLASNIMMEAAGSGSIVADEMVGQSVSAKLTGSGNISITVLDGLDASVAGSGSVSYKGNPKNVSKSVTGSGSVSKI